MTTPVPAAPVLPALSHLRFRHLLLLLHLAEHGSLHQAARYLSISQPAATAMLIDLESQLGLRLFDRSHRGMAATEAARALLDRARTIVNEFVDFSSAVGRIVQGRGTLLRIGVVPQAFASYLPQVLADFLKAGGCAVRTTEGTGRQLLAQLLDGQLDCVVGRLPVEGLDGEHELSALSFLSLYDEDICLVVGAHHPLGRRRRLAFGDLAGRGWVLQRRDSSVRQAFNAAFLRRGESPPEPVVETGSYVQSLAIVAASELLTVAPRRASEIQRDLGLVAILPLTLGSGPMQVGFINRKTAEAHVSLRLFRSCFEAVVRRSLESGRSSISKQPRP